MRIKTSFLRKAAATVAVCLTAALAAAAASAGAADAIKTGDGPQLSTSRDGGPILTAAALAPGEHTEGTVEVSNDGDAAGRLELRALMASEQTGAAGGTLSRGLMLIVTDITGAGQNPIYEGPLDGLGAQALGRLDAGETRSYRFELRLAEAGGNAYQGASIDVDFVWAIRA